MQPTTTIVAIDFGSYRIKGTLAEKDAHGKLKMLYYAEEPTEGCIHRGVIYNMETTAQKAQKIIDKLQKYSGHKIAKVYANVGGQSLRTVNHLESLPFDTPHEITKEDIDKLYEQVDNFELDKYVVLKVDSPEYFVNSNYTTSPVGVQAMKVEARFQLIVAKSQMLNNVNSVIRNKLRLDVGGPLIAPIALGNIFLTEDQKKLGCVLIDFGAGSTTVSVFKKGLLQGIRVIPLGAINITKDLTALHIIEQEAERIKCFGGSAISEPGDKTTMQVNAADKLSTKLLSRYEVCRYIEARTQEILDNVQHAIKQMISIEDIGGGIVVTGGGSELAGLIEKLSKTLTMPVDLATGMVAPDSYNSEYTKNPKLHLLYAIVEHATEECLVVTGKAAEHTSHLHQEENNPKKESAAPSAVREEYPEEELFHAEETPPVRAEGELFAPGEIPTAPPKTERRSIPPEVQPRKKFREKLTDYLSGLFPKEIGEI